MRERWVVLPGATRIPFSGARSRRLVDDACLARGRTDGASATNSTGKEPPGTNQDTPPEV